MCIQHGKKFRVESVNTSQLLSKRPAFVSHFCLAATAGGSSTIALRNGQDVNAPVKMFMTAIASTHFGDNFEIPAYFDKGLYIECGANVAWATVQFAEERTINDDLRKDN